MLRTKLLDLLIRVEDYDADGLPCKSVHLPPMTRLSFPQLTSLILFEIGETVQKIKHERKDGIANL